MPLPNTPSEVNAEERMRRSVEHVVRDAVSRFYDECGYAPRSVIADIGVADQEGLATFNRITVTISHEWPPG